MSNNASTIRFTEVPGNKLWYRNMCGAVGEYNKAGERNFAIELDDETAENLIADGWTCINHKPKSSKDPDSELIYRFKIKMNFNSMNPPRIYVASRDGKRRTMVEEHWLDDQNIDKRRIEWCDIEVNPYTRTVNGKEWCSAYLSEITFKLQEGGFDYKYAEDVPF